MAFNGKEGEIVTLSDAAGWTEAYRNTIQQGVRIAHFFGREKLEAILDQEDCMGIRIYHGLDENGKKVLVLVGAKADENDMVDGVIVEKSIACPSKCSQNNRLNSK